MVLLVCGKELLWWLQASDRPNQRIGQPATRGAGVIKLSDGSDLEKAREIYVMGMKLFFLLTPVTTIYSVCSTFTLLL